MDTEKTITQEGLKKCNSRLFPKNIVFITARGTVGKVVLSSCDMAMNQSCYALKGKDVSNLFVFLLTKKLIENFQKVANGGVFDAIVVETFESMEIVIPNADTIESFKKIVQPIFDKILSNSFQIQKLSRLRDGLLPRLMSGELRVRNFNN